MGPKRPPVKPAVGVSTSNSTSSGTMAVINPAYLCSYDHMEDAEKSLNTTPMACKLSDAKRMEQIMERHADVADVCCCQRALLAFCADPLEFKFVEELLWGLTDGPEAQKHFREFVKIRQRQLEVYQIGAEGLALQTAVSGCSLPTVRVVMGHVRGGAEMTDFVTHAMPVQFLRNPPAAGRSLDKMIGLAKRFTDLAVNAAIAAFMQQQAADAAPVIIATVPPEPTPAVQDSVHCQTDWKGTAIADRLSFAPGEEFFDDGYAYGMRGTFVDGMVCQTPNWCRYDCFDRQGRKEVHRMVCMERVPDQLRHYVAGAGEHFTFIHDVSPDRDPYFVNCLGLCIAPGIAGAYLSLIRKWGTRTRYVFPERSGRVHDRFGPDVALDSKSMIENNGVLYTFQRDDFVGCCYSIEAFRLRPVSFVGSVWNRMCVHASVKVGLFADFSGARAKLHFGGDIDAKQRYEHRWTLEHQTEKDPLSALMIARERSRALAEPRMDQDPAMVANRIRELRKEYDFAPSVGGRFEWGYCYSCGEEERGKYKSRVCKNCEKHNAPIGRLFATGEQVLTFANDLCYPGLVHTQTCHPPLKESAKTRLRAGQVKIKMDMGSGMKKVSLQQALKAEIISGRGPTMGAVGLAGRIPYCTAAGVRPLVEAIIYRIFKDLEFANGGPILISQKAFERCSALAHSSLLLGDWLNTPVSPMEVREWIASMSISRRRKMLTKALAEWEARGKHHPDFELISPFVKKELLAYFGRDKKSGSINGGKVRYIPRLIQAPHDETHLIAGPYLKPLVKTLKLAWNEKFWIFYASVGPQQLNAWLASIAKCKSFFWSDYTAFDSTFSEHTWKMIEGFYRHIYPNAEMDFWKVLDIWRRPKGRAFVRKQRAVVEYTADVCNCSGRDDTALANALFNGLALSCSFAAALAEKPVCELNESDLERAAQMCKIAIVGDDSLVGCDFDVKGYEDQVIVNLKSFGLIVTSQSSDNLYDVTFLGMMPYPNEQGIHWGPTLGRRLYKLFWMKEQGPPASWARGVAQAMAQYTNVPILHELCRKVDSLLSNHSVTKMVVDENRCWTQPPTEVGRWNESTIQCLLSRYNAVGLTREMIMKDLEIISKIDRLPAMVRLNSLECILLEDDL
jgi:hypothetical protein